MNDMNREIREAMEAGARALNSLRQAQNHLETARGWGLIDLFGGGWLTTLIKHSKLDDAQNCLRQAQYDLQAFSRELRGVSLPELELDGFLTFADYFFDGFLADYMVQRRINEARGQIAHAAAQVEDILRALRQTAESRG